VTPRERLGRAGLVLSTAFFVSIVLALVGSAGSVRAADPAFGTPSASATYGKGVTFEQPFTPTGEVKRVEILLTSPGSTGPFVSPVKAPSCCQPTTLSYGLLETDEHLVPNTRFTAQWRVTDADGSIKLSEPTSVLYKDTRFDWKSVAGPVVRVHWYDGSTDFGKRALAIGEKGIDQAAKVLGVTETEPVDFYIYSDEKAFYDALGPGTRENVGGEAHADIRTMFALIAPDEIDATWVSTVVPHELTHLVFDTAVKNPYHFPPRWLNEGLAVYLSEGYGDSWRSAVKDAVKADGIIPLDGLTGQFPTTRDQFFLAYGESVSAVDYLVRTFGQDALVKLVRSYADGVTDDEAFKAGIGRDVAAFQAGWLADLGTTAPTAVGPQPGPIGPLPSGWVGAPDQPVGPPPSSGTSGGPTTAPIPPASNGDSTGAIVLAVAVGAVVGVVLVRRRRAAPRPAQAEIPGWGPPSDPPNAEPPTEPPTADPPSSGWQR
jgi:hypothetical protein